MDLKSLVGTNYYIQIGKKLIHIGKASYGYKFLFRWNPDYYKTPKELEELTFKNPIYNHHGRRVNPYFFKDLMVDKAENKSIRHYFLKQGKGNLIHSMNGYIFDVNDKDKSKKTDVTFEFIDEDFGIPPEDFELLE